MDLSAGRSMFFITQLYRWLFERPAEPRGSNEPGLATIDTQRIAADIGLEGEARRLGEANLPATDDTELSGIESRIVRLMEKSRQDFMAWGAAQLEILNQDIERRDITPLVNKAAQADKEFERRASSLLAEKEQLLTELRADQDRAETELRAFVARHGLRRQAIHPDSAEIFLRFSLLALLVVGEGALNAVFFAKGLSSGLVGGFVYAGSLALGNVMLAYLWGRHLLPQFHHRSLPRRLLGALALPGALATAFAVALLIAHFRDALSSGSEQAARVALETLGQAPFALREVQSWVLFGVSFSFAAIAWVDSYGLDDPYPGYGAVTRRRDRAMGAFLLELELVRGRLEALKSEVLDNLDRSLGQAKAVVHALHETIEHKVALGLRLQNALADVDNCLDTLLRSFRDVNRLYRQTPTPAYFSQRPSRPDLRQPDFGVDQARLKYQDQSMLLNDFVERIEGMRSGIQSSFVLHRDGLKPLELHFDPVTARELG